MALNQPPLLKHRRVLAGLRVAEPAAGDAQTDPASLDAPQQQQQLLLLIFLPSAPQPPVDSPVPRPGGADAGPRPPPGPTRAHAGHPGASELPDGKRAGDPGQSQVRGRARGRGGSSGRHSRLLLPGQHGVAALCTGESGLARLLSVRGRRRGGGTVASQQGKHQASTVGDPHP